MRSGAVLLTLAITAIALILVCVPLVWMYAQVADISDSISTIFSHDITRVEEHWMALPRITAPAAGVTSPGSASCWPNSPSWWP